MNTQPPAPMNTTHTPAMKLCKHFSPVRDSRYCQDCGKTQAEHYDIETLLSQRNELVEALKPFARLAIETCPRCEGTGATHDSPADACGWCGGTGKETGSPDPSDILAAQVALANAQKP